MIPPSAPEEELEQPFELWRALGRLMRKERVLLLLLVGGLGVAELVLGFSRPDYVGLTYSAYRTGGHPIEVTSEGFRVVPTASIPPSAPVVLGLGDSTTFGTGVGAEDTWPLALGAVFGADLDVRNAGSAGASLETIQQRYQTIWGAQDSPEVVVLLVTGNMISFTDFRWGENVRAPREVQFDREPSGAKARLVSLVQSSAVWKAVNVHVTSLQYAIGLAQHNVDPERPLSPLMAYGWVQPNLGLEAHDRMWQRFETSLQTLTRDVQSTGSCLAVGFLPPRFMIGDALLDNLKFVPRDRLTDDPELRIQTLTAQLDVPFIDVGAALRTARAVDGPLRAPLYIPGDYTHLSAEGHRIIAGAIAERLGPLLDGSGLCNNAL